MNILKKTKNIFLLLFICSYITMQGAITQASLLQDIANAQVTYATKLLSPTYAQYATQLTSLQTAVSGLAANDIADLSLYQENVALIINKLKGSAVSGAIQDERKDLVNRIQHAISQFSKIKNVAVQDLITKLQNLSKNAQKLKTLAQSNMYQSQLTAILVELSDRKKSGTNGQYTPQMVMQKLQSLMQEISSNPNAQMYASQIQSMMSAVQSMIYNNENNSTTLSTLKNIDQSISYISAQLNGSSYLNNQNTGNYNPNMATAYTQNNISPAQNIYPMPNSNIYNPQAASYSPYATNPYQS